MTTERAKGKQKKRHLETKKRLLRKISGKNDYLETKKKRLFRTTLF